jgi:hypothetical protein
MAGGETYDVFLSYSRVDSAAAETLRARLKEAGLNAFLDRYGLPAGQPWQPWLEEHLLSCRALIVLVGPLGFGEWQHREIQLGHDRQASAAKAGQAFSVIPVLLPGLANDAVPAGSFLSLNTWVDLRPGFDEPESLQRLVAGARGRAIDAAAAFCRSASRTRASSSAGSGSSTNLSGRSASVRPQMSSASSAARAAASPRSSTPASFLRCAARKVSATSRCGGSFN